MAQHMRADLFVDTRRHGPLPDNLPEAAAAHRQGRPLRISGRARCKYSSIVFRVVSLKGIIRSLPPFPRIRTLQLLTLQPLTGRATSSETLMPVA